MLEKRWGQGQIIWEEGLGPGGHFVSTEGGEMRFGGIVWTVGLPRLLNILQVLKSLGGVLATIERSGYEGDSDKLTRILNKVDPLSTDAKAIIAFASISLEVLSRKEFEKPTGKFEVENENIIEVLQLIVSESDSLPLADQPMLKGLITGIIKLQLSALEILEETKKISEEIEEVRASSEIQIKI